MSFDRALVGVAGFVATGLTAFGVNKYQVSNLPPDCLDAIQLKRAEEVLRQICPPGTDNSSLMAFIIVGGLALTFAFAMSPLGNVVGELGKVFKKT